MMAKIKIKDLPKDFKITEEDMSKVMGGGYLRYRKLYSPVLHGPAFGGAAAPTSGGGWVKWDRPDWAAA